jgi:ABC-type Fe3+/spermidine/putrescine transport system ATPase subunit
MPDPAPIGALAVDGVPPVPRRIAMVFQDGALFPPPSVGGPTIGYRRAAERRAGMPDARAEGLGKVQHQ